MRQRARDQAKRPTLSNRSQVVLTGVLIGFLVASYVVDSFVPAAAAVALGVLLLVVRTHPSPGPDQPRARRER